jgi:TetR/AcrR family transcriptional regulator of autoinduction and epiphytic fitness
LTVTDYPVTVFAVDDVGVQPANNTVHQAMRPDRPQRPGEHARQGKHRIMAVATDLVRSLGYRRASLQAVAASAGVTASTVEAMFGGKTQLMREIVDFAIAGDDEPVPMLEREWATRARAQPDAAGFLAVFARQLAESAERAASLLAALAEGTRDDPDAAAIASGLVARGEATAAFLVDGLIQRGGLRAGLSRATSIEAVWALMDPTLFDRLTRKRGWSADRFERSFVDSVSQLLLASPGQEQRAEPALVPRQPAGGPGDGSARGRPAHGQLCYLQLPATDPARSARFYELVFGWRVTPRSSCFAAPGLRGQWLDDRPPADPTSGPLCWVTVDRIDSALAAVTAHGGEIVGPAALDDTVGWWATVRDPAGNAIGLVQSTSPTR